MFWIALIVLLLTAETAAFFYTFKAQWEQNRPKEDGYE